MSEFKTTACVLCSANCGVKVQLGGRDGRRIVKVRGDDAHPASRGYVCNKAARLDYYQSAPDRLTSPLRRRPDGGFEAIGWDQAIDEVATKLAAIRDTHGGESILYYGGGGQGNHLPGAYARSTLSGLGIRYRSNALAQEKTGEFWVADAMFGGWAHGDFEHCDLALFIGKNPWHSHGLQRARVTLRAIANDPDRLLIVIDPKRTETADLADYHLAVRPGRDAWLLTALAAVLVQEGLCDRQWLAAHAAGVEPVLAHLATISVADYARTSGVDEAEVRAVARAIAAAERVAACEDLGVQMNRHSTLVSYVQRLLWVLTGNFARPGTNYLPNGMGNIGRGTPGGASPVTGARIIAGLIPCNSIPEEVITDHPKRFRAMFIESANPVHSLADTPAWRQTMETLELSVVIDVAMTETARMADYVLPACSQYEKAEAAFFNFEFPDNVFHLRQPVMAPLPGTLSEAEIHARLGEALGIVPQAVVDTLRAAIGEGRAAFREAVFAALAQDPSLGAVAPAVLYRSLGPALPAGCAEGAVLWAIAHDFARRQPESVRRAGFQGTGAQLGEQLFDAFIESETAVVFARDEWDGAWERVPTADGRIHLDQPEMLAELEALAIAEPFAPDAEHPFVLAAGERRAFTANTVVRDPEWRRKDRDGALLIHPDDARGLNLGEGSRARVTTERAAAEVVVSISERMSPGFVSLPNGQGVDFIDAQGNSVVVGVAPNELTSLADRDKFVGTPWHKSVAARIEAIG